MGAVWARWQAELEELGATDLRPELEAALDAGQVLLIFDGLDEVPEQARGGVRAAVGAVLRSYPQVRHVIVTCRTRSYAGKAVLPDFATHALVPLRPEQVRQFVSLGRMDSERAALRADDLEQAALSDALRFLSSNPMLLTVMAIVHQRNIGLPRERVRLYAQVIDVMLSRWQERKGIRVSERLAEVLRDSRRLLERLAYQVHGAQAAQGEGSDLLRKDLLELLEGPDYFGELGLAGEFLDYVDQSAGLLVGHGGEEGQRPQAYAFPHRTFQEYLAGCHMASGRAAGSARAYWRRAEEGDYWTVAARLGAEELLYNNPSLGAEALLDLAYRLCPGSEPDGPPAWRAALWSGHMAALAGAEQVCRDTDVPEDGVTYLERLRKRLVCLMEGGQLRRVERAEAGRVLARLGDPRAAVTSVEAMELCSVPSGPFWMGEWRNEEQNESLDYGYWMGRYPVTNAQFKAFIDAGGYREPRYWGEAMKHGGEVQGRWNDTARSGPHDFGFPFTLPNYPVAGLTWYEAVAFARWLTEHLHREKCLPEGFEVRLPSEAEWEKAARGGIELPAESVIRALEKLAEGEAAPRRVPNPEPKRVTRTIDLLTWLLAATKNFPRAHRNTFTRRPLDAASAFDLEERLGEANRRKDRGRLERLERAVRHRTACACTCVSPSAGAGSPEGSTSTSPRWPQRWGAPVAAIG